MNQNMIGAERVIVQYFFTGIKLVVPSFGFTEENNDPGGKCVFYLVYFRSDVAGMSSRGEQFTQMVGNVPEDDMGSTVAG